MKGRGRSGPWVIGLVLIALGVLFLLDTTDVVEGVVETWWPLLLILWGTAMLVTERGRSVPGTIVLLLGLGFLLQNLEVLDEDWFARYWPVILIVVGAGFVLGALRVRGGRRPRSSPERSEQEDGRSSRGNGRG